MNPKPTRRLALAAASAGFAAVALSGCLVADNTAQTIAFAGSDTTQDVMAAITAVDGLGSPYNALDTLSNIKSQEPGAGVVVPTDANCGTLTYTTPAGGNVLAPNGSGAGRDALKASVNAGNACIDVARSSSGPRAIGQDLASFEYYAFGLDAVGWSSASANAPSNLTLAQLQGIYNCTYTNWSQVGGTAGTIERYWPQAGSGTRSFAQSDLLGFDPTAITGPGCAAVQLTQENSGTDTIQTNGDQATAIAPYSAANWVAQARGTQADQRGGQVIKSLNGQALVTFPGGQATPNTSPGPIQESNVKLNNPTPAYPGIRYVFNVTDAGIKNYPQVVRYMGFENRANVEPDYSMSSPLCSGTHAALLTSYGFGPLDTSVSARNIPGSTCRLFTP